MAIITLRAPSSAFSVGERIMRDGVELEKGVVITQDFLERNKEFLAKQIQYFTAYPDAYLDIISPSDSTISLFPYQRLFLRACMRYRTIYITAARATSKTFLSILAKYLQCSFVPGHRGFIAAPNKNQAAKIAKQKIEEIWRYWPLLKNELELYNGAPHANFSKDGVELFFKNGSRFTVVGAADSDRGMRNHSGLIDEVRDIDGDMVSEVILPQLNVSRRDSNGLVNPYEKINQQVIYATSAGTKSSYAYEALLDAFEQAIINPSEAFVIGLDYRIPAMHGLIDGRHVQKLRMSPSYNESTFAAEYLGTWEGGSEESWFNFDKLQKYRKIKNPEFHPKYRDDPNVFYLISVDVARMAGGDTSVACVFRINIRDQKYYSTLVNIKMLGLTDQSRTFEAQTIDIKKLIEIYNPREVVIDVNGLGRSVADLMIKEQIDSDGHVYSAYGFKNIDEYKRIQPRGCEQIVFGMVANGPLNSKIHGNAYSRLNNGMVRFLISEQEARNSLLSTQIGQKMSLVDRTKRLMPHELTTKLFDEMSNLRLKRTGVGLDIVLERINTRFPKDKFSAFEYGLWRIKELEEESYKRTAHRSGGKRQLIFYTGGN